MRKIKKYQYRHFFTLEQLHNSWVGLNNTTNFSDMIPKYWNEGKHIHIMKKNPCGTIHLKMPKRKIDGFFIESFFYL